MEIKIKCPDCGKDLKITIEEAVQTASKVVVRHLQESEGTWADIAELIHANATLYYKVGDEIECTLKDGTEVVFVVAAINPYAENEVAFVLKDCLPQTHTMNDEWTNEGGWRDSGMRKYLNEEVIELLPDDLRAVIKERTIKQVKDGEEYTSTDKLWLLSRTELTGENYSTDSGDVHFPLFKDERSRVKQIDGETRWYWLRSPGASNSTNFCIVSSYGGANSTGADGSNGVAFSFLI